MFLLSLMCLNRSLKQSRGLSKMIGLIKTKAEWPSRRIFDVLPLMTINNNFVWCMCCLFYANRLVFYVIFVYLSVQFGKFLFNFFSHTIYWCLYEFFKESDVWCLSRRLLAFHIWCPLRLNFLIVPFEIKLLTQTKERIRINTITLPRDYHLPCTKRSEDKRQRRMHDNK